jgi:hypothetical protein
MITTPKLRQSWEKKQEQRQRLQALKQREREAQAAKDSERQAQIERIKQNRERREANAIKSASYQVVRSLSLHDDLYLSFCGVFEGWGSSDCCVLLRRRLKTRPSSRR